MSIAVQTLVGEAGQKAVTELSYQFNSMINCGGFQYGLNSNGIYLLNTEVNDDSIKVVKSFILAESDYGIKNNKWFYRLYLQVRVSGNTNFTVSIKPNDGDWVSKLITTKTPGVKTISFRMPRKNTKGNFHKIKISSEQYFRVYSIEGLPIIRSLGIRRK